MLMIPNIIWSKNKPKEYDPYVKNENKVLLLFERVGEVLTTGWTMILLIAFLLLSIYGKNLFLFISVIILGIGHIGIHLNHNKEA